MENIVSPITTKEKSIISTLCSVSDDRNVYLHQLKQKIADKIYQDRLFKPQPGFVDESLNPTASLLFGSDRFASETPELSEIVENIQIGVKINHLSFKDAEFRVGHLRFQMVDIIPMQIFIFVEYSKNFTLMLTCSNPQLQAVTMDYIGHKLNCFIKPVTFGDAFLRDAVDMSVQDSAKYTSGGGLGGLELAFTTIKTIHNSLHTIVIDVEEKDIRKFSNKSGFFTNLADYLQSETAIDFNQLELTRVRSEWFILDSNGRLRMSRLMSYRTNPARSDDPRPTIWNLLLRIYDDNVK